MRMALTERERTILEKLKEGKSQARIADELGTTPSSVSGSLARLKTKVYETLDDAQFLQSVGILRVEKGVLILAVRDAKALSKRRV